MHLILFDVDGTLIDSIGYESGFYGDAISAVLGEPVDRNWSRYAHVTDAGVLDEIIDLRPRDLPHAEIHQRVHDGFVARLREHFARDQVVVREIPGAKALLAALRQRSDCAVGIATGGWQCAAELKLAAMGLDTQGLGLATGSDARARTEIMQIAAERTLNGRAAQRTTYFGDQPWDQRACVELGFEFVAVGGAVEHAVQFADLSDHAAILAALGKDVA